jgi:hypothetical protein
MTIKYDDIDTAANKYFNAFLNRYKYSPSSKDSFRAGVAWLRGRLLHERS